MSIVGVRPAGCVSNWVSSRNIPNHARLCPSLHIFIFWKHLQDSSPTWMEPHLSLNSLSTSPQTTTGNYQYIESIESIESIQISIPQSFLLPLPWPSPHPSRRLQRLPSHLSLSHWWPTRLRLLGRRVKKSLQKASCTCGKQLYWLVNRDPYFMAYCNPYRTG